MASLAMDLTYTRPPSASCCPLPSSLSSAAASCRRSSTRRQLQFPSSSSFSHTKPSWRRRRHGVTCASAGAAAPTAASLYAVLGVEKDVSMSSIKSAYRRLALRYHPDVVGSLLAGDVEASTRKFLEVQEAYEILSDPERRADYDFSLMHPFCAQALSSNFHMRPPRRRRSAGSTVSPAWKLQWEAQISRLKQKRRQAAQHHSPSASSPPPPPPSTSWGARVRWHNLSQRYSSSLCA